MKLSTQEIHALVEVTGDASVSRTSMPAIASVRVKLLRELDRRKQVIAGRLSGKVCSRCKRAIWTCRNCGDKCCQHRCTLRDIEVIEGKFVGMATCGKCWMKS